MTTIMTTIGFNSIKIAVIKAVIIVKEEVIRLMDLY